MFLRWGLMQVYFTRRPRSHHISLSGKGFSGSPLSLSKRPESLNWLLVLSCSGAIPCFHNKASLLAPFCGDHFCPAQRQHMSFLGSHPDLITTRPTTHANTHTHTNCWRENKTICRKLRFLHNVQQAKRLCSSECNSFRFQWKGYQCIVRRDSLPTATAFINRPRPCYCTFKLQRSLASSKIPVLPTQSWDQQVDRARSRSNMLLEAHRLLTHTRHSGKGRKQIYANTEEKWWNGKQVIDQRMWSAAFISEAQEY